jgi:hypothetical protein
MKAEYDDVDAMRQAFAALAATATPLDDCPEPPRLWAAARGEASPGETRDLIDHTASCPVCAEAWRLAVRLEDAAPASGRQPVRRPAVAQWWPAAAAAALVVAAVGVYQLREPAPPPVPTLRSAAEAGVVSDLAADAVLPREACVLAWHPEPAREGLRYAVQVTTDDLRPVVEADDLAAPRFEVPAAALAELPPGARILWRVEAFLPGGRRLASETFSVRIE